MSTHYLLEPAIRRAEREWARGYVEALQAAQAAGRNYWDTHDMSRATYERLSRDNPLGEEPPDIGVREPRRPRPNPPEVWVAINSKEDDDTRA